MVKAQIGQPQRKALRRRHDPHKRHRERLGCPAARLLWHLPCLQQAAPPAIPRRVCLSTRLRQRQAAYAGEDKRTGWDVLWEETCVCTFGCIALK